MEWLLELMGYIRNVSLKMTAIENVAPKEVDAEKIICGFWNRKTLWFMIYVLSEEHVGFFPCKNDILLLTQ